MKQFYCWGVENASRRQKSLFSYIYTESNYSRNLVVVGWRAAGIIMKPCELLSPSEKKRFFDRHTHSHSQTQGPP